MMDLFNVYCDESCHLENDGETAMTLGAVWCPASRAKQSAADLRDLKAGHGMGRSFETKWTKVSPAGYHFYEAVIDYFFNQPDLHFRALVAHHKSRLRHDQFGQTHDTWYYKMYFQLLSVILDPTSRYAIYLDIKDTRSVSKLRKLGEVLCNNMYDFDRQIIARVQAVRSHEVEHVQLADLLTGIVSAANRKSAESTAKNQLISRVRERSGYDLTRTTLLREDKVNIFRWDPQQVAP